MRLLVDLRSHLAGAPAIIQAQADPVIGSDGAVSINGKYAIPLPLDVEFPITLTDYVLDGAGEIDGGDVASKGYAHLLALYPQYGNVYFNPLLTSDHVAELVLDQSFWLTDGVDLFFPRFQTGREVAAAPADGQMPTHTAILAQNDTMTPVRPGLIITNEIDLSLYTLNCTGDTVGADEFAVYWKLYDFNVTEDIAADEGLYAGVNSPALRQLKETDQEPVGLTVYLTPDNGTTWTEVNLLEPVFYASKTTSVRLAFRNDTTSKMFLASFALLF